MNTLKTTELYTSKWWILCIMLSQCFKKDSGGKIKGLREVSILVSIYYERPETSPDDCPMGGQGGYTIYKSNKVCVGEKVPAWLWSSVAALLQAGLMVSYVVVKVTSLLAMELIQPRNNWTRWHHTSVRNHEGTVMIISGKIRVATRGTWPAESYGDN